MSTNMLDLSPEERAQALKELLQSTGWKLLVAHAAQAWGVVGYGQRMQVAVRQIPMGPERAFELAATADRIDESKRAVDELMDWPTHELARVSAPAVKHRPFAALRRTPA